LSPALRKGRHEGQHPFIASALMDGLMEAESPPFEFVEMNRPGFAGGHLV
jgi:hypothetical protein